MTSQSSSQPVGSRISSARARPVWVAALVITAVIVAAYVTSFRGALVFDDLPGIANNPTIRDLSQPGLLLVAIGPQGGTLSGRPVPNLTLALNYAISGDRLWSYHATNLLIHVAAALTLFGIVRRTLSQPVLADRFGSNAGPIAFAVALLWGVHPLQTESVTYLIQRVESLMGLFYLLTLYCFLRAVESPLTGRRWYLRAFFTCLLGMGCKEVMVTAPVVVALYDRIFVTGSWRETLRTRWKFHVALMSTWIVLGGLVVASGGRGGTAGYQVGINAWNYLLTQCKVILDYLKLSLWPFPLVFDHNVPLATGMGDVWPQAVMLCVLLGASVYLLIRRPALGFLCAAFFLILAPTSSVVPISDAKVEHRMYLPLASIVTAVVLGIHRQLGRIALPVWLGLALALGTATAIRNLDYQSPRRLWGDTVQKIPGSPRAHNNLGAYLLSDGEVDAAREHFSTALRLNPNYASAHYNLAQLLEKTGRMEEAVHSYETAIRLNPKLVDAHVNSAHLLDRLGRAAEAVSHYERALVLDPDAPDVHADLAASLLKVQQLAPAIDHLKTAVELAPDRAELWCNLARAFLQGKDFPAARRAGARALQLKPDFPEAHYVLGNLDIASNDFPNAIAHYQRASELAPDYIPARNNLANALLVSGKIDAAIAQYQIILQQRPNDASVRENLARAFELRGTSAR